VANRISSLAANATPGHPLQPTRNNTRVYFSPAFGGACVKGSCPAPQRAGLRTRGHAWRKRANRWWLRSARMVLAANFEPGFAD